MIACVIGSFNNVEKADELLMAMALNIAGDDGLSNFPSAINVSARSWSDGASLDSIRPLRCTGLSG